MTTVYEPLSFPSLDLYEETVPIGGKEYILREASGDAACKFRNAIVNAQKFDGDGNLVGLANVVDTEPLLVSLCLFEKHDMKPVKVNDVRKWPSRVQKALFARIKEVSDLGDKDDLDSLIQQRDKLNKQIEKLEKKAAERKNSQPSSEDGSD